MKKKIALCLHGYFNSLTDNTSLGQDGYAYIQKHILSKGDVDVFVHSWDLENRDTILDLYKPKKSIFESQIDFSQLIQERGLDNLQGAPRPPQSVLSHLYSVEEVMKLPYQVENVEYDIVIKARFDLGRINRDTSKPGTQNPYPVQCINFLSDIKPGNLYMADWQHFHMGPADMWFYGDKSVMYPFTTLYQDLLAEFKYDSPFSTFATNIENNPGDLSNAIAFYKYWMVQNGLWYHRVTLQTTWE